MKRILVADDNSVTRKWLSKVLRAEKFAVSIASGGQAALKKLREMNFDLVLLDVWMPHMDMLNVLKALGNKKSLPIVLIITLESTPGTLSGATREHGSLYVSRPINREKLIALVREHLGKKTSVPPIEVVSARPEWVELLVPCSLEAAALLEAFMAQLNIGLRDEVRGSVGQAFHELLMNAIEWGGKLNPKHRVRISCLRAKRMLLYRIADPGRVFKFDGLNHAAVTHAGEPMRHDRIRKQKGLRPGGFGLVLVKANADELLYNEAQNEVVFVKYLD
jgi:CheY-like chemotaxis protein/anti-sigma regulatory factor (Ser/Thr protein kinase)